MALKKVTYIDEKTVIEAENLNDIQDAIIVLEGNALPNATANDNGKVLKVVDGKWAMDYAPSGETPAAYDGNTTIEGGA